jgi:hypothetical protein
MRRITILLSLAILILAEFGLGQQCFSGYKLMSIMETCSCGATVTVNACSYGTNNCALAATFVPCGSPCEVGNSQLCQELRRTSELARLEAWVRIHPGLRHERAPVLQAAR